MLSDSFASNVPDFSSTDELLAFIRSSNDILGSEIATEKLNALSFNCSKYENRKDRDVAHFFALLSLSPQLKQLSELVSDPDNSSVRIQRLILLCRNTKTPNKNKVLNTCLLFSAQNLRRKDEKFKNLDWNCIWSNEKEFTALHAESLLEPNTTALFYRHLFAFFNANGLNFSMAKDFNYTGGFQAYWKELWAKGKKIRHSLGEKPLQATFDANADSKIRSASTPFRPFLQTRQGYDDCMLLFAFRIGVVFQLRGGVEVCIFLLNLSCFVL